MWIYYRSLDALKGKEKKKDIGRRYKMLYINVKERKRMIGGIAKAKEIKQKGLIRASVESNLRFKDLVSKVC